MSASYGYRQPIQPLRGTESALAAAAADPGMPLEVDELCVATDTWRTYLVVDNGSGPVLQLIGDGGGGGGGGGYGAGAGLIVNLSNIDVVGAAGRIDVFADNIDLAQVGTAGTYDKVTTDAYGRVISGSTPDRGGAGLVQVGDLLNVGGTAGRIEVLADSIDLATTGIAAGSYDRLTIDAYGRATAGSNPDRGGAGLVQTGDLLDVGGTAGRIVVNADSVDLADAGTPGTYTKVTTDQWGRVTAGESPTSYVGLGLVDVQPLDATLTALAGLTTAVDQMIYATGVDAFAMTALTSYARTLLDDLNAAEARATLELGTIATQDAENVNITGGTISGVGISGGTMDGTAITNSSFATGTISDSAITNGTMTGTAITNVTIDTATITNAQVVGSAVAIWVAGYSYKANDLVLAVSESEVRLFRATQDHLSSDSLSAGFPGDQALALPDDNFATGQWREVSPLRGNMGNVQFEGGMAYNSSYTTPIISGTQNDWDAGSLTELRRANFLRVEASGSGATITGIAAPNPVVNQGLFICNVGTKNITISDTNHGSLAANQFLLGGNRTLQGDEGIMVIYDDVTLKWRSQAIQI